MHSHSFQDTKFKRLTQVMDFQQQVVEGLTILRHPRGLENEGLITQKTLIRHAFAQFSRLRVETSQERRRHPGTGRGRVEDSTVSPQG